MMSSSDSGENSQVIIKTEDVVALHSFEQLGPFGYNDIKTEEVHYYSEPTDWSGFGENQEAAIKTEKYEDLHDNDTVGNVPEYDPTLEDEDPDKYNPFGPDYKGYLMNVQTIYFAGYEPPKEDPPLGNFNSTKKNVQKTNKKAKYTLKCYLCSPAKQLDSRKSLYSHLDTEHPVQETYHCVECNFYMRSKVNFNLHLLRHDSSSRPHECSVCTLKFTKKESKLRHEVAIHKIDNGWKNDKHVCSICGIKFAYESSLKLHENRKHKAKQYQHHGKNSNEITTQPETAEVEKSTHAKTSNAKPIKDITKCYLCKPNLQLKNRRVYLKHLANDHPTESSYRCDECNLDIDTKAVFNAHLSRHDESFMPDRCSVCTLGFRTSDTKLEHEATVHKIDNGWRRDKYACSICGIKFAYESSLKVHEKHRHQQNGKNSNEITTKPETPGAEKSTHAETSNTKTIKDTTKCYLCKPNLQLKNRRVYFKHLANDHPTESSYRCDECNLYIGTKSVFNAHLSRHDESFMPERCSVCTLGFRTTDAKLEHEATVHKIDNGWKKKEHICSTCGRKFGFECSLRLHNSKVHSVKNESYVCSTCGKSFSFECRLRMHEKAAHKVKPTFHCYLCIAKPDLKSKTALEKHFVACHERQRFYNCDHCTYKSGKIWYLNHHMLSQHSSTLPKK